MAPVAIAMMWAAIEVWRDLFDRRYPPYVLLKKAATAFDSGDLSLALAKFKRAAEISARYHDLAALSAAWHGIARAREALGDNDGSEAATATARDADRQLS